MFTDIVDNSTFIGEEEQQAFAHLRKNRQLQKPVIEQFGVVSQFGKLATDHHREQNLSTPWLFLPPGSVV